MKIMTVLEYVAMIIGLILVFGAIGTDDFYLMELHQAHDLEYVKIIIGVLMCLPVILHNVKGSWYGC